MVSVIIPAWGETPYLKRAISSIPISCDIEIIKVAPPNEFPNSLPAARMDGVKIAKGEWILFLDADDRLAEGAIEKLLSVVCEKTDIVCANLIRVERDGRRIERRYSAIGPSDVYNTLCAKLIRKRLFNQIKVDFRVRNGEDLMITEQLMAASRLTKTINEPVYEYIDNDLSMTHCLSNELKALDLLEVDNFLSSVLDKAKFAQMHNRIVRDAMLLLIRARKIGDKAWISASNRLTEPIMADIRHGILKRIILGMASFLGKVVYK